MNNLILSCFLVLYCSFPVHALDDTDDIWRKIDPALGIEKSVRTQLPDPPMFDAHFTGAQEKEFILYQWESETCNVDFMGWCLWRGSPRWKRVLGISGPGGKVTGSGKVDCQARVVLTGWYKMVTPSASTWVQARTTVISYVPCTPRSDKPIGVIAGFEDGGGGHGTVEFIHGP